MSILDAIILAIVEGLTEFLPVSSTGHLIIVSHFLRIVPDPFSKTFIVAVQLGAIVSVMVLYWKKFILPLESLRAAWAFYRKLFIAFLPAAVLGLLLNDLIDQLLESVVTVSVTLILGGLIFLWIDAAFRNSREENPEVKSDAVALKIGLFQTIALIPGVSRSAATIIGGLTQKLSRKAAAEFSFFLAIPTLLAATGYKLLKYYKSGNGFDPHEIRLLLVGNAVAFIVAIFAMKFFIEFLVKHGFRAFGYYRIAVGISLLLLYYLGNGLTMF
jgi:undecaprenyl-diphosphatase